MCAVCVANGHCELQALANDWAWITCASVPLYPNVPVDTTHARFGIDHNRCILCTRCVRVCDEIEGAHTWDVTRPRQPQPDHHRPQPAMGRVETCTGCGKCVQACPTGALFEKGWTVGEMRQHRPALVALVAGRSTEGA